MSIINELFIKKFMIEDEITDLEDMKVKGLHITRRIGQLRNELKKVRLYIDVNETVNNNYYLNEYQKELVK